MSKNQNFGARIYGKYCKQLATLISRDQRASEFYNLLMKSSESEFSAISRHETKVFDEKWINSIAIYLGAVERIIKDPKKHIKTVGVLTPVELARKTSSESIIHLSSHSQYVKSIDEQGNVIPDKLLNIEAEDDFAIYENRFIKTLIGKLLVFVESRYDYIAKKCDTRDTEIAVIKNKFTIGEVVYEYESKVKISTPSQDDGKREYNLGLLAKITDIRRQIRFYAESDLLKQLTDAKPVFAPIQQTNIIRKNKDYNACYHLFKFLDSYDKFGIAIKVREQKRPLDEETLKNLYFQIMFADLALDNEKTGALDFKSSRTRTLKPHVNRLKISDPALSDDHFLNVDIPGQTLQSFAQERSRLRAQKIKEEKKNKKLRDLQREKERAAREKEKERALNLLKRQKEAEKLKRALELEREKKNEENRRKKAQAEEAARQAKERQIILEARRRVEEEAQRDKERRRSFKARPLSDDKLVSAEVDALSSNDSALKTPGRRSKSSVGSGEDAANAELKKALNARRKERLAAKAGEKALQAPPVIRETARPRSSHKKTSDPHTSGGAPLSTNLNEQKNSFSSDERPLYLEASAIEKTKKLRQARAVKGRIIDKAGAEAGERMKTPNVKKIVSPTGVENGEPR